MKHYRVMLTSEERQQLQSIVSGKHTAAKKRLRSQILLAVDEGKEGAALADAAVIKALGVSHDTVEKVREQATLEGPLVAVERRPTTRIYKRKLDGRGEARLIAEACSKPPLGRNRWTMQLLADRLIELKIVDTISDDAVHRTLKKMRYDPISMSIG